MAYGVVLAAADVLAGLLSFAPVEPELGVPELGVPELGVPELGVPELGVPELGGPDEDSLEDVSVLAAPLPLLEDDSAVAEPARESVR
jgi:hypothetical protein